jgi:hypothetical protein
MEKYRIILVPFSNIPTYSRFPPQIWNETRFFPVCFHLRVVKPDELVECKGWFGAKGSPWRGIPLLFKIELQGDFSPMDPLGIPYHQISPKWTSGRHTRQPGDKSTALENSVIDRAQPPYHSHSSSRLVVGLVHCVYAFLFWEYIYIYIYCTVESCRLPYCMLAFQYSVFRSYYWTILAFMS